MSLRRMKSALPLAIGAFVLAAAPVALSQNTPNDKPPVLDVHVHAMDESFPTGPMCPNTSKFTASDPKTKEAPFGWVQEECTPKLYPAAKGEYMKDVVAEMERLNVTAVVFGDPASVEKWKEAAPKRVIPGTGFAGMQPGSRVPLDELRKDFTTGGFKVMGEIGLQYEGISPSDPSVDQYFALAEERHDSNSVQALRNRLYRARFALSEQRPAAAETELAEIIPLYRKLGLAGEIGLAQALTSLGDAMLAESRPMQALAPLTEAVRLREKLMWNQSWELAVAHERLGEARLDVVRAFERIGLELFAEPADGMFVWARFPQIEDSLALAEASQRDGIMLAPGAVFRPHLERSPWMRFNVAVCQDMRVLHWLQQQAVGKAS